MTLSRKYIFLALSVILFLIFVAWFWNYFIDDAFITFRYAENLADGHGLVYNAGDKPIEGYSNFLWLLILSACYLIGLPTYLCAKVLGVLFFLMAGLIWFRHFSKNESPPMWAAPVLFLATPLTAFWAVSGLELGLYAFLLAASTVSLLDRSRWAWLFLALLVLGRPEGFLIGLILVAASWLLSRGSSESQPKFSLSCLASVLLAFAVLVLFRMIVFGYPMPNTFYAKSEFSIYSAGRILKGLSYLLPMSLLFIVGTVLSLTRKRRNNEVIIFGAAVVAQIVLSTAPNPVMNFNLRYMIAFVPMLYAVGFFGLESLPRPLLRKAIYVLLLFCVIYPIRPARHFVLAEREIMGAQDKLITWARTTPADSRISISDAGRIPYYSHRYFYDLFGLTSEEIAHQGFNALGEFWRLPDYFIFVGYMRGKTVNLIFDRERHFLYSNPEFTEFFRGIYNLIGVISPSGNDAQSPGYNYILFQKDRERADSLLRSLKEQPLLPDSIPSPEGTD